MNSPRDSPGAHAVNPLSDPRELLRALEAALVELAEFTAHLRDEVDEEGEGDA